MQLLGVMVEEANVNENEGKQPHHTPRNTPHVTQALQTGTLPGDRRLPCLSLLYGDCFSAGAACTGWGVIQVTFSYIG